MATYKFTETDKTLASSFVNNTSNIVFLPINSSWGPDNEIVEVNSIKGLANNFGTAPVIESTSTSITSSKWPENITSYSYAQGVLNSGLSLALARMTDTSSTSEHNYAKWVTSGSTFNASGEQLILQKDSSTPKLTSIGKENPIEKSSQTVTNVKIEGTSAPYTFSGQVPDTFDVVPVTISETEGIKVTLTNITEGGESTVAEIQLSIDEWGILSGSGDSEAWTKAYNIVNVLSGTKSYIVDSYQHYQGYTISFTGKLPITSGVSKDETGNRYVTFNSTTDQSNYQIAGIKIGEDGELSLTGAEPSLELIKIQKLIESGTDKFTAVIDSYIYTIGDDTLYVGIKTDNAVSAWTYDTKGEEHLEPTQSTIYEQAILTIPAPAKITDPTAGIWAKYRGTYGNNIGMYYSTQLKTKTTGKMAHVGKSVEYTEQGETKYKFVQTIIPLTYTYSLLMNVLVNGSLKEQLEIATIDFILQEPALSETASVNYKFQINISDVDSDYVNIASMDISAERISSALAQKTATKYLEDGADITEDEAQVIFANFLQKASDSKYEELVDKWQTDIKFLSGGPYVESIIETGLIAIADQRADCIALVDHPKTCTQASDVETFAEGLTKSSYAALYSPWCLGYPAGSSDTTSWIPASYYALTSIGKSFSQGNSICDVPAGVNRGSVTISKPAFEIGRTTMEKWQKGEDSDLNYCINPIMNIRNYGYCIFGQRNLLELAYGTTSALQEVGVRITLNEIKKWVRDVCIGLTFESNTNRTWNEFVSRASQCLNKLQQGGFLTSYNIYRDSSTLTEQANTNSLNAVIQVYVTRALENFNINVEVYSGEITVAE